MRPPDFSRSVVRGEDVVARLAGDEGFDIVDQLVDAGYDVVEASSGGSSNFVVENAAGAGGTIGASKVAKAAPDGHTLLNISTAQAISQSLYAKLGYNLERDLAPVILLATSPLIVIALGALFLGERAGLARRGLRAACLQRGQAPALADRAHGLRVCWARCCRAFCSRVTVCRSRSARTGLST